MKYKTPLLLTVGLCLGLGLVKILHSPATAAAKGIDKQEQIILSQASNLDPKVLKLSLTAYQKARDLGYGDTQEILTVIDYSKPSTERRLWVINLKEDKVLFNTWVAHGKNSGDGKGNVISVSNQAGSLESTSGMLLTDEPYTGHNGYSLRLIGLEKGINDNAEKRAIVIHGAKYVGEEVAKKYGRLGRSWGCPAVAPEMAAPIIDTIKNKTLVFAYYPSKNWHEISRFLAS